MNITSTGNLCTLCEAELKPAMIRCRQCGMIRKAETAVTAGRRQSSLMEADIFTAVLAEAQKLGLAYVTTLHHMQSDFNDILLQAPDVTRMQETRNSPAKSLVTTPVYRSPTTAPSGLLDLEKVNRQSAVSPNKVHIPPAAIKIERVELGQPIIPPEQLNGPQQLSAAHRDLIDELDAFAADS